MRFQGKIVNWNDDKGFGFVEPNGGGIRAFVHISSFKRRSRRPINGDMISYKQTKDTEGKGKEKYKAVSISLVADKQKYKQSSHNKSKFGVTGTLIVIAFCLCLVGTVATKLIPFEVLYFYALASVVTFTVYGFDKSAAKNNRWRTPENYLHILALIGGWPGAFYAQNILRHKSIKKKFKQVYWVTVMINICTFMWLLTEKGQYLAEFTVNAISN